MKNKLCPLAVFVTAFMMLLSLCNSTASAQTTGDDYPRAEFYGGYSRLQFTNGGSIGFDGFNVSVTGNLAKYVGLKGDLSGHYHSESGSGFSVHNFLAGVQIKNNSRASRLKPFAHALFGAARFKASTSGFGSFSETGFAMAFGVGLDVRASKHFDVRVAQVDYNPIRIAGGLNHNIRLGAGIVIH